MSDDVLYFWSAGDPPIRLQLRRWAGAGVPAGRTPVLLLHGASANHGTFTVQNAGDASWRALAPWLFERGFDPWLLDWRGSSLVVADLENRPSLEHQVSYNFNRAAAEDLPGAIRQMRSAGRVEGPIIGTIVFFVLRQTLADLGSLYLLMLGVVAIVVMLKFPKGIWGFFADRYGWQLFPLKRRLRITDESSRNMLKAKA